MTAEVIIMNKRGVAMAADSACTRSSSDGRPIKIFNSAKKLFNLSKKCPIGVVTYSNASFNGIPWDLLFQDFYTRYTEVWTTVEECSEAFIHYLEETPLKGDTESFFGAITEEMKNRYIAPWGDILDEDLLYKDSLDLILADNRTGFDDDFCDSINEKFSDTINEYVDNIAFSDGVTEESKQKIKENMLLALQKKTNFIEEHYSGVAICGYGTSEFFPVCQEYLITGSLDGRLVYEKRRTKKITLTNSSTIIPLAQRDVMDGFISGIQGNVKSSINKSMHSLIRGIRISTIKKIKQLPNADQLPLKEIEDIIREQVASAESRILLSIDNSHSDVSHSMISMVSDLNIPDLAKIAKNLISMTSFRKEVSDSWETVGGPVDVAVISKTDGFVWIEKKDIYDRDLNVHTNNSFTIQED